MAGPMEEGFSMINGPKKDDNTPVRHHARSHHRDFYLRWLGLF